MSRVLRRIAGVVGGVAILAGARYHLGPTPLHAAGPQTTTNQAVTPSQPSASAAPVTAASSERALLNKYCVTCHNDTLKTAGLSLQTRNVDQVSGDDAAVWEKVVRKLRGGAMPPVGVPRPEKAAVGVLASHLETALDRVAMAAPTLGRQTIHRLNRAEYANAIRDLLILDVDTSSLLPPDDAAYGFDNIADVLSVSPGLLERYLSAARRISRLAIGDPTISPVIERYDVSKLLLQNDRMSEDLPFGSSGGMAIRHYFPLDGEYVARIFVGTNDSSAARSDPLEVRLDRIRVTVLAPTARSQEETEFPPLEVRFAAKAGTRLLGVSFVKKALATAGLGAVGPVRVTSDGVSAIEIGGPYNVAGPGDTPSRRTVFVCHPTSRGDEEPCARKILTTLARRAYRRPATEQDVRTLLRFYTAARGKGNGFERGIERAVTGLLVSPKFLFRVERDPANAPKTGHRISDVELASRLSFFLWSSIPDEELLGVAERGKLHEPAVLEQQVRRMLADRRARALVNNFAAQWLFLRNLRTVTPDGAEFPTFEDSLREAMRQETELFIESQMREDRPLIDLLGADYTFLNERLARHYGIPQVYGSHFRRVTLPDDRRGGLLGQASILTVTSYANRTSVVQRGKWVLENILGTPPPAPPPNVPPLEENTGKSAPKTLRARMEQHRKNPVCAGCHARMDPVGFALENFDAVGEWRTTDAGAPIDPSGALPDGTKLNGPADLRQALVKRGDEFVTTFTERLLTYALGRGVEYYDQPAIRQVLRAAAPSDYRWSSIILGIVKSQPFQMRAGLEPDTTVPPSDSQRRTQQ